MIRFTCYFHVSEKDGIVLRTPSNAKHTIECEILDSDSLREGAFKRQLFARKCDMLAKALCKVYPSVTLTKVRTSVTTLHHIKK